MMDRLQEKHELVFKLGVLFGPLQHLAENPSVYDDQDSAEVIARYCHDYGRMIEEFRAFSKGQPGCDYNIQFNRFYHALYAVHAQLGGGRELKEILAVQLPAAKAAIAAIPVPREATIYQAHSPFSTYCVIKALVEGDATSSVVWVDPYMSADLFSRYLRDLTPEVHVKLVTSAPREDAGRRDRDRWEAFLDVSRMYAAERGADAYALIVHGEGLHDRWLLLDGNRLYTLGGSAKDAGSRQYFTLAQLEASPENLEKIQGHVKAGEEYFGPNTPADR